MRKFHDNSNNPISNNQNNIRGLSGSKYETNIIYNTKSITCVIIQRY